MNTDERIAVLEAEIATLKFAVIALRFVWRPIALPPTPLLTNNLRRCCIEPDP